MEDAFDPYHKWLGIKAAQQPPSHYRLLAIEPFESDPDVISNAADQRMAHVRSHQIGKHSQLSQKLLNEIAAAKVCLLNPQAKAKYDARLLPATSASDADVVSTVPSIRPIEKRHTRLVVVTACALVSIGVAISLYGLFRTQDVTAPIEPAVQDVAKTETDPGRGPSTETGFSPQPAAMEPAAMEPVAEAKPAPTRTGTEALASASGESETSETQSAIAVRSDEREQATIPEQATTPEQALEKFRIQVASATPEDCQEIANRACELVESALKNSDFTSALAASELGLRAAHKADDRDLIRAMTKLILRVQGGSTDAKGNR